MHRGGPPGRHEEPMSDDSRDPGARSRRALSPFGARDERRSIGGSGGGAGQGAEGGRARPHPRDPLRRRDGAERRAGRPPRAGCGGRSLLAAGLATARPRAPVRFAAPRRSSPPPGVLAAVPVRASRPRAASPGARRARFTPRGRARPVSQRKIEFALTPRISANDAARARAAGGADLLRASCRGRRARRPRGRPPGAGCAASRAGAARGRARRPGGGWSARRARNRARVRSSFFAISAPWRATARRTSCLSAPRNECLLMLI